MGSAHMFLSRHGPPPHSSGRHPSTHYTQQTDMNSTHAMTPLFPRGLYGITPEWDDTDQLLKAIRAAHAGGMSVLQWRRKHAPESLAHTQLTAVVALCNEIALPSIINDQLELAMQQIGRAHV